MILIRLFCLSSITSNYLGEDQNEARALANHCLSQSLLFIHKMSAFIMRSYRTMLMRYDAVKSWTFFMGQVKRISGRRTLVKLVLVVLIWVPNQCGRSWRRRVPEPQRRVGYVGRLKWAQHHEPVQYLRHNLLIY
jgi:hypothetical protein